MKNFRKFILTNKRSNLRLLFQKSIFTVLAAFIVAFSVFSSTAHAQSGGPLVLMGIDAEDGGPGGHGPISVYVSVTNSVYTAASNGGTGILVIGGGKSPTDNVTTFWNAVATGTGRTVTYVNGATNITNQSFAGFRMIAVVSSVSQTSSGGLTQAENTALSARNAAVATHVNSGGGLLGFSQSGFAAPLYGYLSGIGTFTVTGNLSYQDITPTPAGTAVGITNALDVCCWHDRYDTFPPFLSVLATIGTTTQAAAIGNLNAFISTIQLSPLNSTLPVGSNQTLMATVAENNTPVANRNVTLSILSGPNAGLMFSAMTNAMGVATFNYSSAIAGTDTLRASYIDSMGMTRLSNTVTVQWTTPGGNVCLPITTTTGLDPGGIVSFNPLPPLPGTVPIQHIAPGTGLQSITVNSTVSTGTTFMTNVGNAMVTVPAFTPGTKAPAPAVNVTYTVNNPGLPVDFTIEARSQFHGISIRVRCACTRTVTVTDDPSLFPGGLAAVSVDSIPSATGGMITVSPGIGALPLTTFSLFANPLGNVTFTNLSGTNFNLFNTTYSIIDPGLPVDFTLSARDPFHGVRIRVRCAAIP